MASLNFCASLKSSASIIGSGADGGGGGMGPAVSVLGSAVEGSFGGNVVASSFAGGGDVDGSEMDTLIFFPMC